MNFTYIVRICVNGQTYSSECKDYREVLQFLGLMGRKGEVESFSSYQQFVLGLN